MKTPFFPANSSTRYAHLPYKVLGLALLALMTQTATAATISGRATDVDGEPLYKVPVCLAVATLPGSCDKTRWTDKQGLYTFPGLKAGENYTVTVNGNKSAAVRKQEVYANYVWTNASQSVPVASSKADTTLRDFVGKFNFSNFQRALTLTEADFPELSSVDLQGQDVFLKVFIASSQPGLPPETVFLGQVRNAGRLSIEASVPLPVHELGYELYSATLSLSGSIALTDD